LEPLATVGTRAVLLGAIRLDSVRLIDNLLVTVKPTRQRTSSQ
jgi:pantothenate synthetase